MLATILLMLHIFLLYMFIRNIYVYKVRVRILDECSYKAKLAIDKHEDWGQYYHPFDTLPSYEIMLLQFWKWDY